MSFLKRFSLILLGSIILFVFIFYVWCWSIPGKLTTITHIHNEKLKIFEKSLEQFYPLGDDSFTINHGDTYSSFFDKIGKPTMTGCIKNDEIIALICGVLKNDIWYICDMKVAKAYRRQHIMLKLLLSNISNLFYSRKIYGISMDSKNKSDSEHLISKIPFLNPKKDKLLIYTVDYDTLIDLLPIFKKYRGDISFVNNTGVKDIILKSTNKPMKLLHVVWGNKGLITPIIGYNYMFCSPINDIMTRYLPYTNTTATIISCGMHDCDWKFIVTSEI